MAKVKKAVKQGQPLRQGMQELAFQWVHHLFIWLCGECCVRNKRRNRLLFRK